MKARRNRWWILIFVLAVPWLKGQDAGEFYRQNCYSCHTIGGGRLSGPDLIDVNSRRDRPWLVNFLQNPKAVIDSGDPYARQLVEDARGVIMPRVPGMTPALAQALLDLIENESKKDQSDFAGLQMFNQPLTRAHVARGKRLFVGLDAFQNGGAACLSCHSVTSFGGLGGGRLGPDLTAVYERLGGREGLAGWMLSPATPTMRALFAKRPLAQDEILPLVAYLEEEAKRNHPGIDPSTAMMAFFLLGLGGAAFGLFLMDAAWKSRFHAVRRTLVESVNERFRRKQIHHTPPDGKQAATGRTRVYEAESAVSGRGGARGS